MAEPMNRTPSLARAAVLVVSAMAGPALAQESRPFPV